MAGEWPRATAVVTGIDTEATAATIMFGTPHPPSATCDTDADTDTAQSQTQTQTQ